MRTTTKVGGEVSETATKVKLTPQNPIQGTVDGFEEWTGDYGPNYTVYIETSDGLVAFTEKKDKIDAQLKRLGLTIEAAEGLDLRFWKKPKADDPTKGYLNIDRMEAGGMETKAPAPKAPASKAPAPKPNGEMKWQQVAKEYESTLDYVLEHIVPRLEQKEVPYDAASLNSIVATIRIESARR